ncbi:5,10-methenyltetrahydrofolate synthetase [Rhizobium subbaraonis]|uniref:5-formyltetrahydrofolate cyclo-ligase n=1 Tax=Rhizobium subbaraonis TaxID=908946 RepID=A0A285UQC2_9HYPH|nr:5-formyltetrahydrofolate cyclo-ligase [Rhizobium subbaraonis]SOC44080.1 5,10-methenyltetrahydrofolate synthetase [Rhizobium subbaraonis]
MRDEHIRGMAGVDAYTSHGVAKLAAWRTSERTRLIAERLSGSPESRLAASSVILKRLRETVGAMDGRRVSLYWPFRGEPDLRPWIEEFWQAGGVALLPVVVEKRQPLQFRSWRTGEPLARGIWDIPIPAGGEVLEPDIVVAPLVGYDPALYRLGYGGGFFDRTLAALQRKPLAIGVGYGSQKIATIRPQAHDIPMDVIIATDLG